MTIIWKIGTTLVHIKLLLTGKYKVSDWNPTFIYLYPYFSQMGQVLSCTLISKQILKCILKIVIFQYMQWNKKIRSLLIVEINNIHKFNIFKFNLWIISKKLESDSTSHILLCLDPYGNLKIMILETFTMNKQSNYAMSFWPINPFLLSKTIMKWMCVL
jgi:hypothetical protein